ncbi:MAG: hypothetical protein PUG14_00705, partial [Acholeplasmatales bacterium]|nr:hypothetical protein [Acholeplasmatales bacterium]
NNKVKFLAGSKLSISKNGTLNINSETVFYQNYVPPIETGRGDGYPRCNMSATLINNGTININSAFGGIVSTTTEGSILKTNSSFSNSLTTTNALTGQTGGLSGTFENHTETAYFTKIDACTYDPNSDTDMKYTKNSSNLNSDKIDANISAISYPFNTGNEYGWFLSSNNNIRYGIRYVDNSDTVNNPNIGTVVSFQKNGSNVTLENPSNTDTKYVFDGFYYDSLMTKKLSLDGGKYIIEPAIAEQYISGNHINIYSKWIDSSASKYTLNVEYEGTSNYQTITKSTASNVFSISQGISLEAKPDFYIINVTDKTNGVGYIAQYIFNGYSINVKDSQDQIKVSNLVIDATGKDTNGNGYFTNFVMNGVKASELISDGDVVTAKANYTLKTDGNDFDFDISFDKTKLASKATGNAWINDVGIFKTLGIELSYSWSCNYSKLSFGSKNSQKTTMTNGSSPWISKDKTFNVTCEIKCHSNIVVASLTKGITLTVGSVE